MVDAGVDLEADAAGVVEDPSVVEDLSVVEDARAVEDARVVEDSVEGLLPLLWRPDLLLLLGGWSTLDLVAALLLEDLLVVG